MEINNVWLMDNLQPDKDGVIKIFCSFSGGRTSSVMTEFLLRHFNTVFDPSRKLHVGVCPFSKRTVLITVLFANTGREDDRTLDFVNNCDKILGFNTIWIERKKENKVGVGSRPVVVNYETACRDGSVFESFISKSGLPNFKNPSCTRDLKERPMHWYIKKTLKWKEGSYYTAIGYRIDEPKRWNNPKKIASAFKRKFILPLCYWIPMSKQNVNIECSNRAFDLGLEDFEGNCKMCYKKSDPKLMCQAYFLPKKDLDWVKSMESKYKNFTPDGRKKSSNKEEWHIYRGNNSVQFYLDMAEQYFGQYSTNIDLEIAKDALLGYVTPEDNEGCSESCEAFGL